MLCPNCGKEHIGYICPNCNYNYSSNNYYCNNSNTDQYTSINDNKNESKICCISCCNTTNRQYNFCPFCGYSLNNNYSYQYSRYNYNQYNNRVTQNYKEYYKSNTKSPVFGIIAIVCIVFLFIIAVFFSIFVYMVNISLSNEQISNEEAVLPDESIVTNTDKDYTSIYPNGVSIDEFDEIKIGMNYAQISYIIGGDGVITSNENGEIKVSWISEYDIPDSYIIVTFLDNKATNIEDFNIF